MTAQRKELQGCLQKLSANLGNLTVSPMRSWSWVNIEGLLQEHSSQNASLKDALKTGIAV